MLTRRDILQKCLALGSVSVATTTSPEVMLAAFENQSSRQLRRTCLGLFTNG